MIILYIGKFAIKVIHIKENEDGKDASFWS